MAVDPTMTDATLAGLKAYLLASDGATSLPDSWTDAELSRVLEVEANVQWRDCYLLGEPGGRPPELTEAVYRRVAVALARRRLAQGMGAELNGAPDAAPPGEDAEVWRLEGPYRRRGRRPVVGGGWSL